MGEGDRQRVKPLFESLTQPSLELEASVVVSHVVFHRGSYSVLQAFQGSLIRGDALCAWRTMDLLTRNFEAGHEMA
jgi:hypothetical protein